MKEYRYKQYLFTLQNTMKDLKENDLIIMRNHYKNSIFIPINWNDKSLLWNKAHYASGIKFNQNKIDYDTKKYMQRILKLMVFE